MSSFKNADFEDAYPGDLVAVVYHPHRARLWRRGYTSFPGEYGFHGTVAIPPETVGILLEKRADFYRILIDRGEIWLQESSVGMLEKT